MRRGDDRAVLVAFYPSLLGCLFSKNQGPLMSINFIRRTREKVGYWRRLFPELGNIYACHIILYFLPIWFVNSIATVFSLILSRNGLKSENLTFEDSVLVQNACGDSDFF